MDSEEYELIDGYLEEQGDSVYFQELQKQFRQVASIWNESVAVDWWRGVYRRMSP